MLRRLVAASPLVVALVLSACSGGSEASSSTPTVGSESPPRASPAQGERPTWLFALTAAGGTAERHADGSLALRLDGVDGDVTAFTDRPNRSVAVETVAEFVDRWADRDFVDDPPNAALALDGASPTADVFVVTLTSPVHDPATGTLSVTAEELAAPGAIAGYAEEIDSGVPPQFGALSLFVDSADSGGLMTVHVEIAARGVLEIRFMTPLATPAAGWVFDTDRFVGRIRAEVHGDGSWTLSVDSRDSELETVTIPLSRGTLRGRVTRSDWGEVTMFVDGDQLTVQPGESFG